MINPLNNKESIAIEVSDIKEDWTYDDYIKGDISKILFVRE